MRRKFYTLFILPHAESRFRKIHVSRGFVAILAGLLVLVAAAGATAPHLWLRVRAQSERLGRLDAERERLLEEKLRFESAVAKLSRRIEDVEGRSVRLAEALGVDSPETAASGGGSGADVVDADLQSMLDEEVEVLDSRADSVTRSIEQLREAWQERERMLASTPNMMPVRGFFSDGFGWRKDPFSGRREFHRGLDIVAPAGAVVRAPADGVVTRTLRTPGYGKLAEISHGYGYRTRYGHLSEFLAAPGQRVERGDPVGRIGSTGRSTGPHLHYEVFKQGRRVNPWRYLGDRKGP